MSKAATPVFNLADPLNAYPSSVPQSLQDTETIMVVGMDGKSHLMDLAAVDQIIYWACSDITNVNPELLTASCRKSLDEGMKASDVGSTLVMAACSLIETEPGYSQVSARLLLDSLWGEVRAGLGQQTAHGGDFRAAEYPTLFKASIKAAVELGLLDESLLTFDLDLLSRALHPERDKLFTYPRLQALCDSQVLRSRGTRLELPQSCFMRVAMGLAVNEDQANARAIEHYERLSHAAVSQ